MLDLADKEFKAAIVNMFKELKESMLIMSKQMQTQQRNGDYKTEPNRNPRLNWIWKEQ